MQSVLPVPPAAISANRMGIIARHRFIQWEANGNPLALHSMAPSPAKVSIAALQLVLLSLPRVSLVGGVNPSLTLMNRRR